MHWGNKILELVRLTVSCMCQRNLKGVGIGSLRIKNAGKTEGGNLKISNDTVITFKYLAICHDISVRYRRTCVHWGSLFGVA